jgi:biotin carboxyl carrier protein
MLKKFNINVDGRSYNVIVEEEGHAPSHPPRPHLVAEAPAAAPAPAAAAPAPAPAPAPVAAPVAAAVPAGAGDVVAPLAGVIDSIEVRVGQTVAVGDLVAVVEAMKMKTDIFAKVAGTVQRIAVKAHESVDTGQVIASIG